MSKSRILDEPILVGREHELWEPQSLFKSALEGKGTTVFVSGEAGSGKTKLVTDFINLAKEKDHTSILTGWCLSDAGIPYFPFIEAFSNYYQNLNKTDLKINSVENAFEKQGQIGRFGSEEIEVNSWLKGPVRMGLGGTVEISPETWKDLTFAAIRKALVSISTHEPTIFFLDDIQWADSASLALLQYVSRTIRNQKVLVIATYRSEDITAKEGKTHPLAETLRLMGRDSLFREVKLSGLNQANVGLLAKHMVGGSVQLSLTQKLQDESQGNPLFIVESLRMLSEKNCLIYNKDKWCLSTDDMGIPSKIRDIILHRVSRLTPNQKKVLEVASVIGSKFDPQLLSTVLNMDYLQVIETLDSIAQSSSLVCCDANNYKFDHGKSRDAVYEEVSPALKKAYHGRIAEQLETTSPSAHVSDRAYHFAHGGNKEKALKYSLVAGQEALSFVLGTEAIKHFNYVLDNTGDKPELVAQREIAMEGLGDGLFANANSEAIKVFEQLSREATSNEIILRATRKAAKSSLIQGNYAHALELVNKTTLRLVDNNLENARFLQVKGMIEGWGGYGAQALEDLQQALIIFEQENSFLDIIDVLTQLCIGYIIERAPDNSASLGQPENALASIIRSLSLCDSCQNLVKQVDANLMAFIIHNKCALPNEAAAVVKSSFEAVQKIGEPVSRAANEATSCWMGGFLTEVKAMDKILAKLPIESMHNFGAGAKLKFYLTGILSGTLIEFREDLKKAVEQSRRGAELAEEADFFENQALIYANLVREYSGLGQIKQADIYFEKMEKIFNETTLSGFVFANVIHLFSKGIYFAAKHQWDQANAAYDEVLAFYLSFSPPTGIMAGIRRGYCWSLLQQGRFDDAKKQYEESKKTMDELESRLVHSNVYGFVLAPNKVQVEKEFNVRLDLVNVSKNSCSKVEVYHGFPATFKVLSSKPSIDSKDGSGSFEIRQIKSFRDEAITLTVTASEQGTFTLQPQVSYVDDLGQTKTCNIKAVNIMIQSIQQKIKERAGSSLQELSRGANSDSDAEIDILKKFGLSRSS